MSIRWQDLPEYEPPRLPSLAAARRTFVAANAGVGLAAALMVVALARGQPGIDRWAKVPAVALWLILLGTGWWWSHRVTRAIHLLESRLPSRARVARAWAWPLLSIAVAELVVLRLDPTEVLDVRPGLAVLGFWIAAWRPFSLCRRMLTSLTRVSTDTVVITFGVVHVALWSLGWWLIRSPHDSDAPLSGVSAAAVLTAIPAVIGSLALTGAADRAISHRILGLRTRDEHRYVRSLGLNPFESRVYLDLVKAKQERERRRGVPTVVEAVRRDLPHQTHSQSASPGGRIAEDRTAARTSAAPDAPTERTAPDEPDVATHPTDSPAARPTRPAGRSSRPPAGREPGDPDGGPAPDGRVARDQPRVASLEATRHGVLLTLATSAACFFWTTFGSLDLAGPITAGRLSQPDVERLDRARTWTNLALAVALPVQAWWVVAAHVWVGRVRAQVSIRLPLLLAGVTTAIAVGFVVLRVADASPTAQAAMLALTAAAAWLAILRATPLAEWSEQRPFVVQLWATGVIVTALVHAVTGGTAPVTPTTEVETLAFVSVTLGLVVANAAVVAGVFSVSLEDDIRSSPIVARRRRRRSSVPTARRDATATTHTSDT